MKLKADCIRWKKSSTTTYVEMLAKELKNRGLYKDELTEDYIKNLIMAAPIYTCH
ncbi:MAG: hypothetical protein ACLSHX_10850 [Suilimivivens sp.]